MANKQYRVLLMCTKCDKVYNGTPYMGLAEATKWHFLTMVKNENTCQNKDCDKPLKSVVEEKK